MYFYFFTSSFLSNNTFHLGYGQSGGTAKTITLSFWVRAYQTGTYNFYLYLSGGKMQTKAYTINASNTWEKKTIKIEPDGADAQLPSASYSLQVGWLLAAGSDYTSGSNSTSYITYADTNFAAGQTADITSSTNNFFHLTGVQLEVGSQATAFEHHSVAEELALCQRYFEKASMYLSTGGYPFIYSTEKRAAATVTSPDAGGTFALAGVTPSSSSMWVKRSGGGGQYTVHMEAEM